MCIPKDVNKLIESLQLVATMENKYKININGKSVSVDIALAGNGEEYDPKWELDMLERKINFNRICHDLSNEDYLYTLIFHSLINKREFPERYHERIKKLVDAVGIKLKYMPSNSQRCKTYYYRLLFDYMNENGYTTAHINSKI